MNTPTPTRRRFEQNAYRRDGQARVVAVTERGIVLDETCFYAEGGGQPGDTGALHTATGATLWVTDTRYLPGRLRIGHQVPDPGGLQAGDTVTLAIDWPRRYRHMRMHTALHVLCALVDAPVTGCAIHAGRGRIDFDLPESGLRREDLDAALQRVIGDNRAVHAGEEDGARGGEYTLRAAPGEGETLRVVTIDGLDRQPCGGTHVRATGELAGIRIARIHKKSRRARRVVLIDETAPEAVE
ncbi:Alanine--tRNA ligase [wastewater metagenome]|uniref:Alanine--tRNA ligase n=2 Tax=unclassified sequences TaxID=12908 RepID=A0A5B8RIF5_9ZZZZ|nr:alanyl-tRNA editing protein [Arhodomonas sp. KWT]QEA07462.1 alanine--tRNA ligase [uncultured organism]